MPGHISGTGGRSLVLPQTCPKINIDDESSRRRALVFPKGLEAVGAAGSTDRSRPTCPDGRCKCLWARGLLSTMLPRRQSDRGLPHDDGRRKTQQGGMVGGKKSRCYPTSTCMDELAVPWHVMIESSSVVGLEVCAEYCGVVCVSRLAYRLPGTWDREEPRGTERRLRRHGGILGDNMVWRDERCIGCPGGGLVFWGQRSWKFRYCLWQIRVEIE